MHLSQWVTNVFILAAKNSLSCTTKRFPINVLRSSLYWNFFPNNASFRRLNKWKVDSAKSEETVFPNTFYQWVHGSIEQREGNHTSPLISKMFLSHGCLHPVQKHIWQVLAVYCTLCLEIIAIYRNFSVPMCWCWSPVTDSWPRLCCSNHLFIQLSPNILVFYSMY